MNTSTSIDLPFDIITDILAMLSVKTLMKCRAVCTSWRTYIDSPYFISKHRDLYNKHHSKNSYLLITSIGSRQFYLQRVTNNQDSISVFLAPFSADFTIPWNIYSFCNGLFLLILYGERQKGIYLWNPFLRKFLILPPCPFVPPFQFTNYVLGFSTSCDDYKVLAYRRRTPFNGNEYEPEMAVYSLRNHLWTIKINPMNVDAWASLRAPLSCNKYVCCGGIVYWFTEGVPRIIHSFDFNTEEFNNVALPEPLEKHANIILFTIGELLAAISSFCIWVLEKHDGEYTWRVWCSESWIKNVFDVTEAYYPFTVQVFFVEERNTFLIIGYANCIHFYQVTSRMLGISQMRFGHFFSISDYVETLALHRNGGDDDGGDDFQTFPITISPVRMY
ncbi:unnamed protein product [Amaranthus hypochondriacus]